jgi:hypothetical protein
VRATVKLAAADDGRHGGSRHVAVLPHIHLRHTVACMESRLNLNPSHMKLMPQAL